MWDPYAEFKTATLPTGLTVHATQWPGRPWEAIAFLIHSGAKHDPIGQEGTAHFVEHLISENACTSKKDAKKFFREWGGKVEFGCTSWFWTRYQFWMPTAPDVFSRALEIFGSALLCARLENCVERERKVILREFHRCYRNPILYEMEMRGNKALYAGTWLERSARPLGYPESISRITQHDLQDFYDTRYVPANMSVVGVGGLSLEQLADHLLASPFAKEKAGDRTEFGEPMLAIAPPTENRFVFEISQYIKTELPFSGGGYQTTAVLPIIKPMAVKVISEMLDDALFEEIRERWGATYHIEADYTNLRHFYEFEIRCGDLEPSLLNRIEEIVESCISSIYDRADLFEEIRKRDIAAASMVDPQARGFCEEAATDLATYYKIETLANNVAEFEALTMDDIREALVWLKPERRRTVIIKP